MLVYADHAREAAGPALLRSSLERLHALAALHVPPHDAIVAAVIELGTVESGIADVLCPDKDDVHPVLDVLRAASEAAGLAVAASWFDAPGRAARALHAAAATGASLPPGAVPARIRLRVPEGYAFYALYPEAYAQAAIEWAATRPPETVVCIGLRTIGTSLTAVVHGALTLAGVPALSWTVRPHGHPYDRAVAMTARLLRRWALEAAVFLLVDEGPGLSGSSLAGTAAALSRLGVPDDRIVFMPAWQPDIAQLRSESARARWACHRVIAAGFDRVRARVLDGHALPADALDISGGRWRQVLGLPPPWPAAHPQHERVKLLSPAGTVTRFAGLGRYGEEGRARAERLAAGGWSPPPVVLRGGFLTCRFEAGRPLASYADAPDAIARAAAYIAWLRRHEATDRPARVDRLADMLVVNTQEGIGDAAAAAVAPIVAEARHFSEPAVAVDGRLLAHEWIRARAGLVKTDALDHHRDHFFPGAADAAWDLAALVVEARLSGAARAACVAAYAGASGDRTVARRLRFHMAAYAAFRLGYCAMAEPAVAPDERARFAAARRRYEETLRAVLAGSR